MQQLQSQWKDAGITANIDSVDQTKYISLIALGDYQAGWFRWYGYPNPDNNYVFNASEDSHIGGISINFTHYTSPELDKNLHAVRENTDFATRKAANDKVIQEVNDQAINIWLFDTPYAIVANKKVRGLNSFRKYPFGNFLSKAWWGEVWIQPT
jgi:peptide/nickel transport system substrate-binding protein